MKKTPIILEATFLKGLDQQNKVVKGTVDTKKIRESARLVSIIQLLRY